MKGLGVNSKLNVSRRFLLSLYAVGRDKAEAWLRNEFSYVGKKSTIDVCSKYL
jgi:NTE family protein